jgi:hypothetical protein
MGEKMRKAIAAAKGRQLGRVLRFPLPDFLGPLPGIPRRLDEASPYGLRGYDDLYGLHPDRRAIVERLISSQLTLALNEFGPQILTKSRRICAIHEGGHAIAAAALGIRSRWITIESTYNQDIQDLSWTGVTCYNQEAAALVQYSTIREFVEYGAIIIGGLVAEIVAKVGSETSDLGEFIRGKYVTALLEKRTGISRDLWDDAIWKATTKDMKRYTKVHRKLRDALMSKMELKQEELNDVLGSVYNDFRSNGSLYQLPLHVANIGKSSFAQSST